MTKRKQGDTFVNRLARRLQLTPKDVSLWEQALTHRSFANEKGTPGLDNERLEYLGDAVIELIVRHWLFSKFPSKSEGEMTMMRQAVVRAESLAAAASRLKLEDGLRLGNAGRDAQGAWRISLLSDALEAVIAVIYLENGFECTRQIVPKVLNVELDQIAGGGIPVDPKSALQERLQARFKQTPGYTLVHDRGPEHANRFACDVHFGGKTYARGHGPSIQEAERAAATKLLQKIEREGTSFLCD